MDDEAKSVLGRPEMGGFVEPETTLDDATYAHLRIFLLKDDPDEQPATPLVEVILQGHRDDRSLRVAKYLWHRSEAMLLGRLPVSPYNGYANRV